MFNIHAVGSLNNLAIKQSLIVCMYIICISREQSTGPISHLEGLLMRNKGTAVWDLVEFGHMMRSVLIHFE